MEEENTYEVEARFADGSIKKVKVGKYSAEMIFRPPTQEMKNHPKYAAAKAMLEDTTGVYREKEL